MLEAPVRPFAGGSPNRLQTIVGVKLRERRPPRIAAIDGIVSGIERVGIDVVIVRSDVNHAVHDSREELIMPPVAAVQRRLPVAASTASIQLVFAPNRQFRWQLRARNKSIEQHYIAIAV